MMKQLVRPLTAMLLSSILVLGVVSPSFAQEPAQTPAPPAQAAVTTAMPPVSLGMAKYNYSRAPKAFPHLFAPYTGGNIPLNMIFSRHLIAGLRKKPGRSWRHFCVRHSASGWRNSSSNWSA